MHLACMSISTLRPERFTPSKMAVENVFFNDAAPTEIYTLSLHDALPILVAATYAVPASNAEASMELIWIHWGDRKSTRLNSSHFGISYAVFFLKQTHRSLPRPSGIVSAPDVGVLAEAQRAR